jgi:hypothetical protein
MTLKAARQNSPTLRSNMEPAGYQSEKLMLRWQFYCRSWNVIRNSTEPLAVEGSFIRFQNCILKSADKESENIDGRQPELNLR